MCHGMAETGKGTLNKRRPAEYRASTEFSSNWKNTATPSVQKDSLSKRITFDGLLFPLNPLKVENV